ncbi:MAG: hypothetical protein JWQ57_4182 [Mucilaginibacter sp.]|nr:hypothetical protein [Mucilaginibacter sp.]
MLKYQHNRTLVFLYTMYINDAGHKYKWRVMNRSSSGQVLNNN